MSGVHRKRFPMDMTLKPERKWPKNEIWDRSTDFNGETSMPTTKAMMQIMKNKV